jgi:dihydroxyacetone kinase-like protein
MEDILADLPFQSGDRVCLLINSLGSTTVTEMLIINRRVREVLHGRDIAVHDTQIGHFAGSQEMAGFSISLMKLDDELQGYYDMPCDSLGLTKR